MIASVIVLACIVGYVRMVGRVAKAYAVEATERFIGEHPTLPTKPGRIEEERKENLGIGVMTGLIWPVYYTWRWWSRRAMLDMPQSSIELRERELRIAEMERQLGISHD